MNADKTNQMNHSSSSDPLDEIFRQTLGKHAADPAPKTWIRIRRDLLLAELLRFKLVNVPRYAIILVPALIVSLGIGGYFAFRSDDVATRQETKTVTVPSKPAPVPAAETISKGNQQVAVKPSSHQPVASHDFTNRETHPVDAESHEENTESRLYLASITMASLPAGIITFTDLSLQREFYAIEQDNHPPPTALQDIPGPSMIRMEPKVSYDVGVNVSPDMVFYKNSSSYYKYNYTFDVGGQFTRGRFYMQSGLGLTYSSDIGSYDISYKQNDSVGYYYSVLAVIVSPGKVEYSTSKVTVYDSVDYVYDYNTRNTYLYLQVPIKAGYNIISRPRFTLGIHGGGYYTMLVYKDEPDPGFYAPDSRILEVTRKDPARYTHSFGLTGGMKVEYKFSRRIFLMVEPNIKYSLNALDENSGSGTVQPFSVGLRAGIWYRFTK